MEKEATNYFTEKAPEYGELVYTHQFPSETALVPAVIIRLVDQLEEKGVKTKLRTTQLHLCLDEALKNAVIHGNRNDPEKPVTVNVYTAGDSIWMVISDEGDGFDPHSVPDPLNEIGLVTEGGRGIYLLNHYTKRIEYWNGGRTIALCFSSTTDEDSDK